VPGVDHVAAVNGLPLDRGLNNGAYPTNRPELRQVVQFRTITPGYFQTMGIPLLAGRDIGESDRAEAAPVVLIGETAARKWWPGRSPIGEFIRIGHERRGVGKFMSFQRVAGVIVATTGTHVFPGWCFERFGDERGANGDPAARGDDELLMGDLHPDEVGGISKVVAAHAQGPRLRRNGQLMCEAALLAVMTRGESQQVMRNGYFLQVIIGSRVSDFVEELSHL